MPHESWHANRWKHARVTCMKLHEERPRTNDAQEASTYDRIRRDASARCCTIVLQV